MFFEEITNQIIAFLKEKDFYFAKKNVLRHNENDGSVVIKVSKSEENYYIKGFTRRTMEEVHNEVLSGNIHAFYVSREWKENKKQIRIRDNNLCQRCLGKILSFGKSKELCPLPGYQELPHPH